MKGDTPVNSTLSVGQARKMVEQLKIEASMCRIKENEDPEQRIEEDLADLLKIFSVNYTYEIHIKVQCKPTGLYKTRAEKNINMDFRTVSKAASDLMAFCDAHACEDPLITPVPTSENPFREKKFFCALL